MLGVAQSLANGVPFIHDVTRCLRVGRAVQVMRAKPIRFVRRQWARADRDLKLAGYEVFIEALTGLVQHLGLSSGLLN